MAQQVFPCTLLESTEGDRIQQFKPHALSPRIAAHLLLAFSMAFEFGGLAKSLMRIKFVLSLILGRLKRDKEVVQSKFSVEFLPHIHEAR
jgi:hypothetical protein